MVSGNKPIPMRARELKARTLAQILFDKSFINPRENIKARIPLRMIPLLNIIAVFCWIPRSLSACCVQVNQGAEAIERPIEVKIAKGSKIPQIPAIRVNPDCPLSKKHHIDRSVDLKVFIFFHRNR